eukprot:CAMPEP_0171340892 /NCGR_PEP_ID=MMETSP0878-20121228/8852_1 /TAXON_ID=67004 /ORGANISM="Thalassiosira weissflogii, Strain CCMP1336" /LENGTH=157 /DNA_ID=CAMNT_0011843015 /DNA_START=41 /DNA_END=514 /DNA_ORIENTATION=+
MTKETTNKSYKPIVDNTSATKLKEREFASDNIDTTTSNEAWTSKGFDNNANNITITTDVSNKNQSPSQRGIIRQPRRISLEKWESNGDDHHCMEEVDELQSIHRHSPVRRGIVRQARRMSLIEEEIDEEFVDVLGVSNNDERKTERRSSFKEEYYIK